MGWGVEGRGRGSLRVRVGFHSGPVVANVVGARDPRRRLDRRMLSAFLRTLDLLHSRAG